MEIKNFRAIHDKEYILELIEEGEHEMQDFKFSISDSRKIARSISAFANHSGGRLLVGVKDNGNIAYDYFTSGTRNGVMMICETWENEEVLKAHMASEHFTTLVPKIEALTKNGLKLEQFTF